MQNREETEKYRNLLAKAQKRCYHILAGRLRPPETEDKDMKEQLIAYLQSQMDDFIAERAKYGGNDRMVIKKFDAMLACKNMAEALIGEPVNLGIDGKVTVGF